MHLVRALLVLAAVALVLLWACCPACANPCEDAVRGAWAGREPERFLAAHFGAEVCDTYAHMDGGARADLLRLARLYVEGGHGVDPCFRRLAGDPWTQQTARGCDLALTAEDDLTHLHLGALYVREPRHPLVWFLLSRLLDRAHDPADRGHPGEDLNRFYGRPPGMSFLRTAGLPATTRWRTLHGRDVVDGLTRRTVLRRRAGRSD